MHDPKTVAFEIYLGPQKRKDGSYRSPFITVWHVDPEHDGSDDSCGWTFPRITKEEHEYLDKVARDQYYQLFAKTYSVVHGGNYSYLEKDQSTFGVIYWLWRVFNTRKNKAVWQYGQPLSTKELNYVIELSSSPSDNFSHHECKTEDNFRHLVYLVYRCWKRFNRKWYQHPRWHIHHWQIQFHPFQRIKRRYIDKCSVCGKRGFDGSVFSDWSGKKMWCHRCEKKMRESK